MKRMIISGLSLIPAVITALLLNSCIYDAPGDRFYRTLWKSQDPPFGTIILDFLCDGAITVRSTAAEFDDYGTYESDGTQATFHNLDLLVDDATYHFKEAHRHNDLLFLTLINQSTTETTIIRMQRLSAYED